MKRLVNLSLAAFEPSAALRAVLEPLLMAMRTVNEPLASLPQTTETLAEDAGGPQIAL
jgi:hypothetical protein